MRFPVQRLHRLVDDLRTSLWFLPALSVGAACLLAALMLALDRAVGAATLAGLPLAFDAGPAAARETLSTIAGSMITVAGVVFSITIVVLALAASQYSPRVIRNFMRDRLSQLVLGVFLGVFAYCLLVLGAVEGDGNGAAGFVPGLSVSLGVGLALLAILFLVLYIHHTARAIQAVHILAAAAEETLAAVDCLFPQGLGEEPPQGDAAIPQALLEAPGWAVAADRLGYVQRVDVDALLACAQAHDLVLRMECHVGDFVTAATPLASIHGAAQGLPAGLEHTVRSAFVVDRFQTVEQDVGYGLREIVDVALRSLSPALNDETSAAQAIDYVGAVLARVAARVASSPARFAGGRLRVIVRAPTFDWLLRLGFGQIVRVGARSPETLQRVLSALAPVCARACEPDCRAAAGRFALRVAETAERAIEDPEDRARTVQIARSLGRSTPAPPPNPA